MRINLIKLEEPTWFGSFWLELVGRLDDGIEYGFLYLPEDLPFIEAEAMNLLFFGLPLANPWNDEDERALFSHVWLEYHQAGKRPAKVAEWDKNHKAYKERTKGVRHRRPQTWLG